MIDFIAIVELWLFYFIALLINNNEARTNKKYDGIG